MAKFQLWKKNEYGDNGIVASGEDLQSLIAKAKALVTEDNFENPLTGEEQLKNWQSYFVEILDEDDEVADNAVYAGKPSSNHMAYVVDKKGVSEVKLDSLAHSLSLFIGYRGRKSASPAYAVDHKKVPVRDLRDRLLEDKEVYFIRHVK